MNKVLIEMGENTKEYHVPYAIARAIETMLNHTDYAQKHDRHIAYSECVGCEYNDENYLLCQRPKGTKCKLDEQTKGC